MACPLSPHPCRLTLFSLYRKCSQHEVLGVLGLSIGRFFLEDLDDMQYPGDRNEAWRHALSLPILLSRGTRGYVTSHSGTFNVTSDESCDQVALCQFVCGHGRRRRRMNESTGALPWPVSLAFSPALLLIEKNNPRVHLVSSLTTCIISPNTIVKRDTRLRDESPQAIVLECRPRWLECPTYRWKLSVGLNPHLGYKRSPLAKMAVMSLGAVFEPGRSEIAPGIFWNTLL